MAEDHHVAPVDLPQPGHDAITRYALRLEPEPAGAIRREQVDLLERVAVDEPRDPLARGQLVLGVLPVERLGVTMPGFVLALAEQVERVDLATTRLPVAHC